MSEKAHRLTTRSKLQLKLAFLIASLFGLFFFVAGLSWIGSYRGGDDIIYRSYPHLIYVISSRGLLCLEMRKADPGAGSDGFRIFWWPWFRHAPGITVKWTLSTEPWKSFGFFTASGTTPVRYRTLIIPHWFISLSMFAGLLFQCRRVQRLLRQRRRERLGQCSRCGSALDPSQRCSVCNGGALPATDRIDEQSTSIGQ